jgi:hypothetical protein
VDDWGFPLSTKPILSLSNFKLHLSYCERRFLLGDVLSNLSSYHIGCCQVKTFLWRDTLSALFSVVSSLEALLGIQLPRLLLCHLAMVVPQAMLFGVAPTGRRVSSVLVSWVNLTKLEQVVAWVFIVVWLLYQSCI